MRKKYNNQKLKFYIGDVRDYRSILNATRGVDFIYHAAALKQVPSCEFHPMEAVKTNILGTENVLEAAIANEVKRVVCLSTDKAVYPINAMGISKAMMEKVMVAKSRNVDRNKTVICGTRYGNVMASRGSVIPLFVDLIRAGKPLTITDPNMTRFMMTLEDAVDLVLYAFEHGNNGDIFVQKAPAATIDTLAIALKELLNVPDHPVNVIGTRHGEKLYEALLSREEMIAAIDMGDYYRVPPDLRDLNYGKYVEQGDSRISEIEDYNSHNTQRLDVEGMKELLLKLAFIRAIRAGEKYNLPVIVSTHPRTRNRIREQGIEFHSNINLLKPLGFHDYNHLQKNSRAVLSDSGTITEESSIMNFPAVNIREAHERPEGFEEASVMMVGLECERVLQALDILATQPRGEVRLLRQVSDYSMPNVSDKVVRIVHSYTDYVKRVVWKEY